MKFTGTLLKNKITLLFFFTFFQLLTLNTQAQMRQVFVDTFTVDNHIKKISFYTSTEGYVAFNYWIGYTSDSGHIFTKKFITGSNVNPGNTGANTLSPFQIWGVKAFNKDTIIVYGSYDFVPTILYSTNQGNSFIVVNYSSYNSQQLYAGFLDMIFPQNDNIGYAVDEDRVLKTINRGESWTVVRNGPGSGSILEAVNNNIVFSISNSQVFKTTNAGTTWQAMNIPAGNPGYINFIDANKGWVSISNGTSSSLYYTSNGGLNWVLKNNPAFSSGINKMKFINDSTGYFIGGLYDVYKTTDSGRIWEKLPRDNNYQFFAWGNLDISFGSNNNQFWAGGGQGFLQITTNGGGTPLPKAYFIIDTVGVYATGIVNLKNYSKQNYQHKWYVNNILIGSTYNASYIHNSLNPDDTIKLIVINGSNTDTLIKVQHFFNIPAPSITSFSPISAIAGTTITINGFNFTGATAINFGGIPASSFTIVSSTIITAIVGTGATGFVSVITPFGTSTKPGFTFIAPPTINSFNPTSGTNGTIVTITGSNFISPATVSFGGILTFTNTVVSPTTITASVNNGSTGIVSVTTIAGTASLPGFTYYATPTVTSITPSIGASGIPVNIIGTGFSGATSVTIGGMPVTSLTINSATSITAVIGAGASGNVVVINPVTISNSSVNFTFTNAPVISSFSPIAGPIGTIVTILGSNFSSIPSENIIYFGAVKANILSSTNNAITVVVPVGTTYQPISVTRPALGLTGYSSIPFNVTFPIDPAAFNSNSFGGRIDFTTDTSPYDVAVGDIDGDGKSDLITANAISGTVSVFRNTSSSSQITFAPRIDIAAAAFIKRVQLNDIDGDGKIDIIFSPGSAGTPQVGISIAKNLSVPGNISFEQIKTIGPALYNHYFVIGDFNTDGKPDIASACENCTLNGGASGAFINVYKNTSVNGNISFAPYNRIYFNPTPGTASNIFSEMRVSDLNNDKKLDIILGAVFSDFFIVFENKSSYNSISFGGRLIGNNNNGGGRISPVIADFDSDGRDDIITNLHTHRNLGNFNFSSIYTPSLNNIYGGFFCDDLNGDGKPDFASTGIVNNTISLSLNKNISTANNILFASGFNYLVGTAGGAYKSGDIDSDGKPEIIFIDPNLNLVSILKNMIGITEVCAGSNTAFTSDVTGTSYLWQVDNGNGFTNINNNANYSGTNTITLQLINIPASFNGYKYRCVVNGASFSNVFSITVNGTTPAVSISAPITSICSGTSVTFTATPLNGGSIPTYQWQVNGVNAGSNSNSFTSTTLNNNDQVKVILTSNSSCSFGSTTTSNIIAITVGTGFTPSVSIASTNTSICTGIPVTFTATPINGGVTPNYQWQVNGINTGTNSSTFTTSTLNNSDQVKVILTSSLTCALPTTATSNIISITVNLIPVANAGNDATVCAGNSVQLNGSGGTTYLWTPATGLSNPNIANPIAIPAITTAYILTAFNTANCFSKDTVLVSVNQLASPTVNINTTNNNICLGTAATFTANATNRGTNPAYQWQVNGINAGTNNNTFTSAALNNSDQVKVILNSNSNCITTNVVTSNIITVNVQQLAVPIVSLSNKVFIVTNPDVAATYNWQILTNNVWGNVVPAATGITYTAITSGEYRVKAVKGLCTSFSVPQATNFTIRIPANNPFGIYLYPNPASNMVTLDSIKLNQQWETLDIIAADGKHVLPSLNIKNQTSVSIDVNALRNGTYFVQLRKKDGEFTTIKFVKQ